MSELETRECKNCGKDFKVHPDANAAKSGYCSPHCESVGKGYKDDE